MIKIGKLKSPLCAKNPAYANVGSPETEVQYILTASRQVQHNTRIAEIIHESIPCHLSFQSRTTSYYYCIKIVEITITIAYILLHFVRVTLMIFVLY